MVCTAHRVQCKTLHFTEHKFPVYSTRKFDQMHLKSTVEREGGMNGCVCREREGRKGGQELMD